MASAAGGIGAGEQRGSRGLSVSFRKVRGHVGAPVSPNPGRGVGAWAASGLAPRSIVELTVRRYIEHQWDAVA